MTLKTKEDIEKYLKENEIDVQSAISNIIAPSIAYSNYANNGFNPMFCYMLKDNFFYQLTPMAGLRSVADKIAEIGIKDIDKMKKIAQEHEDIEIEIDKIWRSISFKEENKEFFDKFKKMLKIVDKWWAYSAYGEDKGTRLGELAISKIMKSRGIDYNGANEVVNILSHPEEKSVFTKERIDFLEICLDLMQRNVQNKEIVNDKSFNLKYKDYFSKYFFNKTDFNDRKIITKEVLINDILKEVEGKSVIDIKKELEKIKIDNDTLLNEKERLSKEINLDEDEKGYILAVEEMIIWLDNRKRDMMKHFYYIFSIMHEIANRFNVKYEDLIYLTVFELVDFIDGKLDINKLDLNKRRKNTLIIYQKNSREFFIHGDYAERLYQITMHKGNEIKGQIASKSKEEKIRGIARVVKNPGKERFDKGEILVTSMTRIEYVPLMKKAKAIITDEGGIACHAAIVSRELGVPCIIGTKIATREIKSGDKVEIDMKDGSVRVIK
jgi:phosphohistidine swiveling domain-containing protein